jgi:hypothetical protein
MSDVSTYKELLKKCVELIDDVDLVHMNQSPEDFKELVKLLVVSAHAVGMNPNQLTSMQDLLQNGKYEIRVNQVDD